MKNNIIILIFLSFSTTVCSEQQNGKVTVSTGSTFTSGDYGTSDTTEVLYIPVSFKYKQEKWSVKLTVPYLNVKGPQNVIRDIGQVSQTVAVEQGTNEGLGDIVLSAGYQLFYLPKPKTLLNLDGKIKFGTADEDKSLGTGETDYSLSLALYKLMGNFTPYATFGRRFYGESSDIELDDVFFGSAGLSYKSSQKISMGLNLYLKEKTANTRPFTRQLSGYLSYKLDNHWKLQGYVIKGLSDNAPDLGGGFSLGYQFD